MPFIKVLRHGQITLPKELREFFGVKTGDILEIRLHQSTIILKPKTLVDKMTRQESDADIPENKVEVPH
jgi:AbrB family looped-hinge helix DNA binding protein